MRDSATTRRRWPLPPRRSRGRSRLLLSLPVFLPAIAGLIGCSQVRWETSYERALQQAAENRTRVLVMFHSLANADCRAMDAEVFADTKVQRQVRQYVPVRLDPFINRQLAKQFGVSTVPAFFVVRPDGEIMGSRVGKLGIDQFGYFLIRNRLN